MLMSRLPEGTMRVKLTEEDTPFVTLPRVLGVLALLTFALLFSLTLYVIIDMEYPRVGLIRVTAMDRLLEDVRDSMR